MSCPKRNSGNTAKEKIRRGWFGDYVCSDCGYNNPKSVSGAHGKNELSKNNRERGSNEKG